MKHLSILSSVLSLAMTLAIAVPSAAASRTYRVATDGDDATGVPDDAAHPYETLNYVMTCVAAGDVVELGAGSFALTGTVTVAKQIRIFGQGVGVTYVTGTNLNRRAFLVNAACEIDHMTIEGFSRDRNASGDASGMAIFTARWLGESSFHDLRVTGCRLDNVYSVDGGALRIQSPARVTRCIIDNCGGGTISSDGGAILCNYGNIFFEDCLIYNCSAGRNGGGVCAYYATFINCTIYGCSAATGGGLYENECTLYNTAIFGCTATDVSDGSPNWTSNKTSYDDTYFSLASPKTAGTDPCQTDSPGFVDAANGDFTLMANSPLVAAGTVCPDAQSSTDLAGNPRVSGDKIDIGCYEYDTEQPAVVADVVPRKGLAGSVFAFTPTVTNVDETGVTYRWTVLRDDETSVYVSTERNPTPVLTDVGKFTVRFQIFKDAAELAADTQKDLLFVAAPTSYLAVATPASIAACRFPYDTPETAHTNLCELIGYTTAGASVSLAAGVHTVTGEVLVAEAVTIFGAGRDATTVWRPQTMPWGRVFRLNNAGSVLRDVTVSGGTSPSGAYRGMGVYIDTNGGALLDATVSNCVAKTYHTESAVATASQDGLIERCIICDNRNLLGEGKSGGVTVFAGILRNSLVTRNRCGWWAGAGGLRIEKDGVVSNATVVANTNDNSYRTATAASGGICIAGAGAAVTDSIVWGNVVHNAAEGANPNFGYGEGVSACDFAERCCFSQIANGESSFVEEAPFVDSAGGDWHLVCTSLCTRRGPLPDAAARQALDLDRRRRVIGRWVDLGCYECQSRPGVIVVFR